MGISTLVAVAHDARGPGAQADQALDGGGGASLRLRFEIASEQNEGDDDGSGVEVDSGLDVRRAEEARGKGGEHAIEISRAGADGDEGVHIGVEVAGAVPGAGVELPAGPELHGRRQQERGDGHRRHRQAGDEGQVLVLGSDHEEDADGAGEEELAPETTFLSLAGLLLGIGRVENLGAGVVAGVLDGAV